MSDDNTNRPEIPFSHPAVALIHSMMRKNDLRCKKIQEDTLELQSKLDQLSESGRLLELELLAANLSFEKSLDMNYEINCMLDPAQRVKHKLHQLKQKKVLQRYQKYFFKKYCIE